MVRISRADPSLMDARKQRPAAKRQPSPRTLELQHQYRQFTRLVRRLDSPEVVFKVALGPNDKSLTTRQRLLKVAAEEGREIVVRKYGNGLVVGLMTPERRTNRGRKPRTS